jgi:hypothetical protein
VNPKKKKKIQTELKLGRKSGNIYPSIGTPFGIHLEGGALSADQGHQPLIWAKSGRSNSTEVFVNGITLVAAVIHRSAKETCGDSAWVQ